MSEPTEPNKYWIPAAIAVVGVLLLAGSVKYEYDHPCVEYAPPGKQTSYVVVGGLLGGLAVPVEMSTARPCIKRGEKGTPAVPRP